MEWQCVAHNPTQWALGRREGEQLTGIVATATRQDDGQWRWQTGDRQGVEPSREAAQETAERLWVLSRLPSPPPY